jgi:DNA replicative helicase MCM subunit Mcm2 (Cdc46/Mcm family)
MAIERLTIARAKTELREEATIDDAREAIRIYSAALKTIGLSPENAGELQEVVSDSSVLVRETEDLINDMVLNSGMLYDDILVNVRYKMKFRCKELGYDVDEIFNEARDNVEKQWSNTSVGEE